MLLWNIPWKNSKESLQLLRGLSKWSMSKTSCKDLSKWSFHVTSLKVHSVHSDLKRKITKFLLHSTLWVGQERGNVFSRQTAGWGWMNKTIWWWSSKEKTSLYSTQGDQLELSNLCSSNRYIEEGIPFIPYKVSNF